MHGATEGTGGRQEAKGTNETNPTDRATKKGDAASPFVEHYDEYHTENGKRKPLRIKTRVLASGKTHVRRTISEALRIVEKKPDGNRKGEHVAQTLLYIGLNEEERDGYRKRVYQVK